jgi:TIR domain
MSRIFISYRRDDSSAWAGRLYDRLSERFASHDIFMDVDTLAPGVDFVEALEKSVGSCEVLVAVIGRHWLTVLDEEGKRRLENAEDFVRIEISTALKRGIRVIPTLVEGASMPHPSELPEDLKALARRNAIEVSHTRFRADLERLIGAIVQAPQNAGPKAEALHLAGRNHEALETITAAEVLTERSEVRWWCAEMQRLRGVFLAATGADEALVDASFSEAIRIAKAQKSVSLEQRAKGTYAEYRRQKANAAGEREFRPSLL